MQNIGNMNGKMTLLLMLVLATSNVFSLENEALKKKANNPTPTAGCASATAIATLNLNNVRTRIEGTGGSMWQDRPNRISDYEVPKRINQDDPKHTAIFAGSLWMGGQDVNGQIKLAAVTFRSNGNDFWPGPLNTSTAEITPDVCSEYDKFFGISRAMVNEFVAFNAAKEDGNEGVLFPDYVMPKEIKDWPAHGDPSLGQDYQLAPYYDKDNSGHYNPEVGGDYPKYDLIGEIDCRVQRDIRLFGDTTIWFVFNDKGNIHSESKGPSIGMEIRGQAFAFATNDEVNNMTFYNYEMINRSTFTLKETYFGQWVDPDLGGARDDFVGCDASRGLGYCYNGRPEDLDQGTNKGYGETPPAIGVDFFEGPYADNDGIANPLTTIKQDAIDSAGIPYEGLGIGYDDTIVDNERYGMKKFVYYNNTTGINGDPQTALEHYNYLRGIWRDGTQMVWGGNAHISGGGTEPADLMFPNNSDPLGWSTPGIPGQASPSPWSEITESNIPEDRRFLESAGPFTLEPGAVNDLTVGVVFSRATTGDNYASVETLLVADDKAQALFDNCFKVSEGPDAPDVTIQELDRELILYLSNNNIASNNYLEGYDLLNPDIAIPDTIDGVYQGSRADKDTLRHYKFQGYQIFQAKNSSVTISDVYNADLSRLAARVDIKDNVKQLVNYEYDEVMKANVPQEMVTEAGADEGIRHSFRFTKDLFSTGIDNKLVNHKTYYYIAIAYGHNSYKFYDPLDPSKLDGQKKPYISSRKMGGGASIVAFAGIPHNPSPESGGTLAQSVYGDQPQITRIEGQGNGGNWLDLTDETLDAIAVNGFSSELKYKVGKGPIQVKVVDPLNVKAGDFRVRFQDSTATSDLTDAYWFLDVVESNVSIPSEQSIEIESEQVFLDYGFSVTIKQVDNPGVNPELGNGALEGVLEFDDPSKPWLSGFSDREGQTDANWIRSGNSVYDVGTDKSAYNDNFEPNYTDPNQDFEQIINGTWAPYNLVTVIKPRVVATEPIMKDALGLYTFKDKAMTNSLLQDLASVDIVFTSDKSKWSRCMVFEAQSDQALAVGTPTGPRHLFLRKSKSVDKQGRNSDDPSYVQSEGDLVGTEGMGWFPGYAVNVETGQRLNLAFAEDSWLVGENGRDMMWNPTSTQFAGVNGELRIGGKHYLYVFRDGASGPKTFPAYDDCKDLYDVMSNNPTSFLDINKTNAMATCMWAGIPLLNPGNTLLETTARVKLRVEKPYESFTTSSTENGGLPMYEFNMNGFEVITNNGFAMDSALILINVVPNPYYAYSEYETGKLDNRVKITNLPEECTVSIYNLSGTLMKRFEKASEKTSLDWDLKNHVNIPVAGGVYLIHVEVPGVGERTLKWYGVMKPTDLNGL